MMRTEYETITVDCFEHFCVKFKISLHQNFQMSVFHFSHAIFAYHYCLFFIGMEKQLRELGTHPRVKATAPLPLKQQQT
jgi:hypothetical protein